MRGFSYIVLIIHYNPRSSKLCPSRSYLQPSPKCRLKPISLRTGAQQIVSISLSSVEGLVARLWRLAYMSATPPLPSSSSNPDLIRPRHPCRSHSISNKSHVSKRVGTRLELLDSPSKAYRRPKHIRWGWKSYRWGLSHQFWYLTPNSLIMMTKLDVLSLWS